MKRSQHKKKTYEDKFARKFYCNSHRFVPDMKKENNQKFRRLLKRETQKEAEKWVD